MRGRGWLVSAAGVLVAATTVGVVVLPGAERAKVTPQAASVNTEAVQKGALSAAVSEVGTLTYRARSDGSPYAVVNQANGTFTELPQVGDQVACGNVLYRVDDRPVLLLCGAVPAYRGLRSGDVGSDVRQLNQNLHALGYDAGSAISPGDSMFTARTQQALDQLQSDKGLPVTGGLALGEAVFLPDAPRVAKVVGQQGASAQRGTPVLYATSGTLEVQVNLGASQQGQVRKGDRVQITLPGNQAATGKVDRLGLIAQALSGQDGSAAQDNPPGEATFPAYVALDSPEQAAGFDAAPVQVSITTKGVDNALSVPVTAIVGKSGGGFAVEVVGDGGSSQLVGVQVGLFDTTAGRVQVEGGVHEGDRVVVPSS